MLLDHKVQLLQPLRGNRAGTDAVLLAAAAPSQIAGAVIDVGAGVGSIGLMIAQRAPKARIVLLENDPAVAGIARENIALNGRQEQVSLAEADLLKSAARRAAGAGDEAFDYVFTNPPFYAAHTVQASREVGRAAAHVFADGADLTQWIKACIALLKPGGRLLMVHRADALGDMLEAGRKQLGHFVVKPIHPRDGAPANRVIVTARKGSRAPLALLPGLVMHSADGKFSAAAEAINRGEALVDMG
ncbi:methyltransferase domain-containing protein [Methylovirgula sp. 4M-Z18]|nr:methyltransferase domain-containing protein [Methylovirgula sp. 4M-Z18]